MKGKGHNFENGSPNINSEKMQPARLSSAAVAKASKGSGRDGEDDERKSASLAGLKCNASSEDDYDEDDRSESDENDEKEQGDSSNPNELSRVRREKRLAMNRASARARRKRKKVLLDSLANQLTDITKQNQTLQRSNDTLRARVEQLEPLLAQAQATISALVLQAGPSLQHHLQLGATATSLDTATQESIRSLLLAAGPALNFLCCFYSWGSTSWCTSSASFWFGK
jgi:myosin heavy subunit